MLMSLAGIVVMAQLLPDRARKACVFTLGLDVMHLTCHTGGRQTCESASNFDPAGTLYVNKVTCRLASEPRANSRSGGDGNIDASHTPFLGDE